MSNINKLDKLKLQKLLVDFFEEMVDAKSEKCIELEYLLKRFSGLRE